MCRVNRGNGTALVSKNILLSAEGSSDPNTGSRSLDFVWSCEGCVAADAQPLISSGAESVNSRIIIKGDRLVTGASYAIILTCKTSLRQKSVTTLLNVQAFEGSDVTITYPGDRINPNSARIYINSSAQDQITYSWSRIFGPLLPFLTPANKGYMALDELI
jgi:hypothetical protein